MSYPLPKSPLKPTNPKSTQVKTTRNITPVYYSGLDCHIFFGDTYLDEVINIQYQLSENVLPLFSYASYTYDMIVRGNRIIQGTFSTNFTKSSPIKQIIEAEYNTSNNLNSLNQELKVGRDVSMPLGSTYQASATDIQKVITASNKGQRQELLNQLKAQLSSQHWGTSVPSSSSTYISQSKGPYFQNSNPSLGGFTIQIKYKKKEVDYDDLLTYTEEDISERKWLIEDEGEYILETLTGVHISSEGKAIDDSGRNILSVYAFQARDLLTEMSS